MRFYLIATVAGMFIALLRFYDNGRSELISSKNNRYFDFSIEKFNTPEILMLENMVQSTLQSDGVESGQYDERVKNVGLKLDRYSPVIRAYSAPQWQYALDRLKLAFPENQGGYLFSIMDCYYFYLRDGLPEELLFIDSNAGYKQVFEIRSAFFGLPLAIDLFSYQHAIYTSDRIDSEVNPSKNGEPQKKQITESRQRNAVCNINNVDD